MKKLIFVLLATLFMYSCAVVPKSVRRPWSRTFNEIPIKVGATVSVIVISLESPLLGSDEMVSSKIKDKAIELLERRGFIFSDINPDYVMKVHYRTEQVNISSQYAMIESSRANMLTYGNNFGVMLASSLVSLMYDSESSAKQSVSIEKIGYLHTMLFEIKTNEGKEVWHHDTLINNESVDILSVYTPSLQMALSTLPSSQKLIRRVKRVKADKFEDYAFINLSKNNYICPALPNYIRFSDNSVTSYPNIKNREAAMAFVDLVETSEYAIPKIKAKDTIKPTEPWIWKRAFLIGQYYLGSNTYTTNVLIELKGSPECYLVKKASILSDNEYEEYQKKYDKWVIVLRDYFNFYE